ncbi:MAG TPA: acetolactate synthase large subunit [Candidatus Acidoferrum sp.]|jgi:acetolactate synthase-1/2/3 large subunit
MNGAESLISTLIAGGVDTCFTNPGTSEMHLVAALDKQPNMRCILGLFEGVVTGAADGYARMAEKPACTLLHLGPGLANGLANLHNAGRAHVPIVNIVGQHASYHLRHNAPLTSDIEGIARPFSNWVRTSCAASEIPNDVVDAIIAARTAPGQIATLIVPADVAWSEGGSVRAFPALAKPPVASNETVERATAMLRSGTRTAILLGGEGLYGKGLQEAGRIATATNAVLLSPYPFKRMERGAGRPLVERIPYVLEQAVERLKEFRQIILAGASAPVSYFAAPGKNSIPTAPDTDVHTLARPGEDLVAGLKSLSAALDLKQSSGNVERLNQPAAPSGAITLLGLANTVAAFLPENTIVVDESMTSGHGMMAATKAGPPHDWLANTGGSIGIAMPMAVGAAVACPNRRVLCLSADGSGMYTAQALWTMARESLKVTTVIFANRTYGVLKREFSYLGVGDPGPRALSLFEIGRPDLDWVGLAKGMGVPGSRVTSLEAFGKALQNGLANEGPTLIEITL